MLKQGLSGFTSARWSTLLTSAPMCGRDRKERLTFIQNNSGTCYHRENQSLGVTGLQTVLTSQSSECFPKPVPTSAGLESTEQSSDNSPSWRKDTRRGAK